MLCLSISSGFKLKSHMSDIPTPFMFSVIPIVSVCGMSDAANAGRYSVYIARFRAWFKDTHGAIAQIIVQC